MTAFCRPTSSYGHDHGINVVGKQNCCKANIIVSTQFVGIAYVGTICLQSAYSCSVTNNLDSAVSTAQVVAHEIGHG